MWLCQNIIWTTRRESKILFQSSVLRKMYTHSNASLFGFRAENLLGLLVSSMSRLYTIAWIIFSFVSEFLSSVLSLGCQTSIILQKPPDHLTLRFFFIRSHSSLSSPLPLRNFLSSHFPSLSPVSDFVLFFSLFPSLYSHSPSLQFFLCHYLLPLFKKLGLNYLFFF